MLHNWRTNLLLLLALAPGIFAVSYFIASAQNQPEAESAKPAQVKAEKATAVLACGVEMSSSGQPGTVWIDAGNFTMGNNAGFPEEAPTQQTTVAGFWMDQTEVTNAQFAKFVAATGYRTLAERGVRTSAAADAPVVAGSAVFSPRGDAAAMHSFVNWWRFQEGANWQHPDGPESSIAERSNHPVVHVAYEDALAYAKWRGRSLPTEAQFEFAAKTSVRKSSQGKHVSNTWQGVFPTHNAAEDGYVGTSPVACYEANSHGAHDLIGNVWEWTQSPYYDSHNSAAAATHPDGFDPTQPEEPAVAVIKGGSYLCSADYCMRYRPEARIGQSKGLGAAHIGFRTVLNVAQ
jgi:formylglycine-generating enzyme